MTSRDGFGVSKQKIMRQNSNNPHSVGMPVLISPLNKQPSESAGEDDGGNFYQIISDIMRGFGDCEKPLDESVQLVEKILLQQLRGILDEVIDVAMERKGTAQPTQRDFEFLMRNNPTKVYRLQKHIKDLQIKRKLEEVYKGRPTTYEDELDTNGAVSDDEQDRDVAERNDEEKIRRVFRADRISQPLNGTQYKEYNEARRSSFYCRNSQKIRIKLRRWINTDIILSNQVYTILSYLAHETIASIVDFAILTRLNSSNRLHEPFHRVISTSKPFINNLNLALIEVLLSSKTETSYTMLHLCPEVTQGRGQDGIKPVTVAEIQEAMRRHSMHSHRTLGLHRNIDRHRLVPYLAL